MQFYLWLIIGSAAAILLAAICFVCWRGFRRRVEKKQSCGELRFTKLILHESGCVAEENEYELVKTEKGIRISNFFGNWWDSGEGVHSRKNCLAKRRGGGMQLYEELAKRFGELGVEAWDGFDETDQNVLDGDGFWLEIELEDGGTVSAHGTNAYPPNYHEFIGILRGLFEKRE